MAGTDNDKSDWFYGVLFVAIFLAVMWFADTYGADGDPSSPGTAETYQYAP